MPSDDPQDFSVLADALEAAWGSGERPDLAELVRGGRGLSAAQLAELCLTDQAFRWRTAEPLRVEDYLALCPGIAQDEDSLLDLAYGEIRTRQQLGDPQAAEEIEARFPALARSLRRQLEVSFWMDEETAPPVKLRNKGTGGATDTDLAFELVQAVSEPAVAEPVPSFSSSPTPVAPPLRVCTLHPSRSAAKPLPTICALHQSGRMGPYELCEVVAHGGMGVVFRARHVQLNRIVALKVIRPDRIANETDRRRFHNETVTVAQLDHPHIVPIYDVGQADGVHYFTMKLMEGGDLQQHCLRYLDDPRAAAGIVADVAGAVHHAHQRGVLHRDVKPSNVLLDEEGRPHVTDFGLARRLDGKAGLSDTGELLGTPAYMAPEHLAPELGPLTVAADVYGLGAVLYVLLTGKPPFEGQHTMAVLESIRSREPALPRQLNPRVDRDLEQVCLKALAKRPADRYADAQELADDLQRYLSGECVLARPLSWRQQRWRWVQRHPDLAALSAGILIVATVLLTLLGVQTVRLSFARREVDQSLRLARANQAEAAANRREAARLRDSAEQQHGQAERARAEAMTQRQVARETAYAATIHHIEMARRAGDTTEFSRLMDEQVPQSGEPDMRGFEWFVLDRLHRFRPQRWPAFRGPVHTVSYSPDGRRIAAAGEPGRIQVLDASTGRELVFWPSLTTTRDVAFSPDGTQLAAVGDDGQLMLFPARGGAPQAWPLAKVPVWQVAFVGNGPLLATCDQEGAIRLFDRPQGQVTATLAAEPGVIQCLAVAPDGQWLVSGRRDGNLDVWDVATGQVVHRVSTDSTSKIRCLAVSADGAMLATGDTGDLVRVARLDRPWSHRWLLSGQHFDRLQDVAFSADGRRVAGCDKSGAVRVWRIPDEATDGDGQPLPPEHAWQAHDGRGYAIAYDPNGNRLATGGQEAHVAVWEPQDREDVLTLGPSGRKSDDARSLVFAPDSRQLAVAAENGVQWWDLPTRKLVARLSRDNLPSDHVAVSRDGQCLAVGREKQARIEVWRRSSDGWQFAWEAEDQPCDHLAFSPLSQTLAVVDWLRDEVAVYEAATGRVEHRLEAKQCWAAEFSPDGQQLAFTELDDIVLWDRTQQQRRRLQKHRSTVTDLAYSPDGRRLASCGHDRRIAVWDARNGTPLQTMMGHRCNVTQVAFVGNDRLVSLGDDGTVLVWHAGFGVRLCSFSQGGTRICVRFAVSPDQRWLACRLSDGDIQLLDLSSAQPAHDPANTAAQPATTATETTPRIGTWMAASWVGCGVRQMETVFRWAGAAQCAIPARRWW